MKCIPITRSGRRVCAASAVIEMELVLLARIAAGGEAPVELGEQRELDRLALERGLDHQLGAAGRGQIRGRMQAGQRRVALRAR